MSKARTFAHPCGYTLVELLVAMAASAVVLASVSLVLRSSLETEANIQSESAALFAARFALDRMAARLASATVFSETTATAMTFAVAEPPDGATTSTVHYSWSGVPGAPLNETVNGGGPAAIVSQATAVSFTYLTDSERSVGVAGNRRVPITQAALNAVSICLTVTEKGKATTLTRDVKMRNL